MPVTAKICGLSMPQTINAAIAGGAGYVGFVFFANSPRNLTTSSAAQLAALVPDHVGRIGVYVDPTDALIEETVTAARITAIQLHGSTPARVAAIRARFGLPVWAAVAIKARADLELVSTYLGAADRILYDAKTPPGAALPGGMGVRFDWRLLDGFRHPLPWALSGGLNADNVANACRSTGAEIVDVSSGVETAPGIKDVDKITAFLKAVSNL